VTSIAFPLRVRILSLLFLGVALFGTANAWVFRTLMLRSLGASLVAQGTALSALVAEESAPYLLHRDHLGLMHSLISYRSRYAGITYVAIYDAQGEVVTSTFADGVPAFLGQPSPAAQILTLRAGQDFFRDFSAPILGGSLGSVRMGLSETGLRRSVAQGEGVILAMVLPFLAAGVAGSLIIAQSVHGDAVRLTSAVQAFSLEQPLAELPVDRKDEIGLVARAVQDMMKHLQGLHQEHMALLARFRDTDRMSSVGLLASGLAHDINNPLSGLIASLERLALNPGDHQQAAAYLPPMVEAARHIQAVLHNLLQFVRHQRYTECPVDPGDAAAKARLLAGHRLPPGVDLVLQLPPGLPLIPFDPVCLLQILVNILINAADAMQGRTGSILLAASEVGDGIVMTITDQGHGMAPEVLQRAFDPLFTTKAPGEGTGLGLAIARQMMRDHGGEITLTSEPGAGTRVSLTFREAKN
jgi:signal transduction histidine kinase